MQRPRGSGTILGLFLSWLVLAGCTGDSVKTTDPPTRPVDTSAPVEIGEPFQVQFKTTAGDFVVQVHPEWAPRGAAQFRELVESGFYDGCRFFRVVPGFMVQFGINGDPSVQAKWRDARIPDDPVKKSNVPGMMTFATSGPHSRTTQVFINYGDNQGLDGQGFSPFGQVIEGMDKVEAINSEYREQPNQGLIQTQGNTYLDQNFPKLDYVQSAKIIEKQSAPKDAEKSDQAKEADKTPAP